MITQEQSEQFFNERLKPVLEEMESLRKRILERGKRNKLLLSGFGILLFLYTYTNVQAWADSPWEKFWMSALLIILLVSVYLAIRPELFLPQTDRSRLYKLFVGSVIREMVRFLSPAFSFQPIYKTHIRQFEKSLLFPTRISAFKESYGIVGKVNDYELRISEIQLRNNLWISFQGWFMQIDKSFAFDDFVLFNTKASADNLDKQQGWEKYELTSTSVHRKPQGQYPDFDRLDALVATHAFRLGRRIQLSVVDKNLYLAIENETPFFDLSFRDDNHNFMGAYLDFSRMTFIMNLTEELLQLFEKSNSRATV